MVACFYLEQFAAQCEQSRLPTLEGEPFVLSEAADVVAASETARALGALPGHTVATARSLCGPDLIILPYDRPTYEASAESLWDAFAVESDVVEPASPEMCYVELSGANIEQRASSLAEAIATRVGCSIRIGLARTKLVARHAAMGSEGQTVVIPIGEEWRTLATLPVSVVPGMEPKTVVRFKRLGIDYLGDVLRLPHGKIPRDLKKACLALRQFALGNDGDPVRPLWPPRRLERRVAFDEAVSDELRIAATMERMGDYLAKELANHGDFCRSIKLLVGFEDGGYREEREKLASPTHDAKAIYRAARRLLSRTRVDQAILSLRLTALELGAGSGVQLALLEEKQCSTLTPPERNRRLEASLRYIRGRWGVNAILRGSLLYKARRIGLWTFPLGHLLSEPVQVTTDSSGSPVYYQRSSRRAVARYTVTRIHDRWRERSWRWGVKRERTVFRVETDPWGISELQTLGVEWRLTGVAD
jgi:nucleotidyltransferase/DNA polymerase involved in DNA repair